MKLLSVSVSLPKEVPYIDKTTTTGIFKEPVSGRVVLRSLNLNGDEQADLKGHGGSTKQPTPTRSRIMITGSASWGAPTLRLGSSERIVPSRGCWKTPLTSGTSFA